MSTNTDENTPEAVQLQQELPRDVIEVREEVAGTWSYHLGDVNSPAEAFCGERVMGSGLTLRVWGNTDGHLPTSFCDECERKAIQKSREGAW